MAIKYDTGTYVKPQVFILFADRLCKKEFADHLRNESTWGPNWANPTTFPSTYPADTILAKSRRLAFTDAVRM